MTAHITGLSLDLHSYPELVPELQKSLVASDYHPRSTQAVGRTCRMLGEGETGRPALL